VPEVVDDGLTGFVVDDVEAMATAFDRLGGIDRSTCRAVAMQRFSVERMVDDYLRAYAAVLDGALATR
jgi:glycosyltransferase involved in cell wall biosynthesis